MKLLRCLVALLAATGVAVSFNAIAESKVKNEMTAKATAKVADEKKTVAKEEKAEMAKTETAEGSMKKKSMEKKKKE